MDVPRYPSPDTDQDILKKKPRVILLVEVCSRVTYGILKKIPGEVVAVNIKLNSLYIIGRI